LIRFQNGAQYYISEPGKAGFPARKNFISEEVHQRPVTAGCLVEKQALGNLFDFGGNKTVPRLKINSSESSSLPKYPETLFSAAAHT
jgi:hypothetical protein